MFLIPEERFGKDLKYRITYKFDDGTIFSSIADIDEYLKAGYSPYPCDNSRTAVVAEEILWEKFPGLAPELMIKAPLISVTARPASGPHAARSIKIHDIEGTKEARRRLELESS